MAALSSTVPGIYHSRSARAVPLPDPETEKRQYTLYLSLIMGVEKQTPLQGSIQVTSCSELDSFNSHQPKLSPMPLSFNLHPTETRPGTALESEYDNFTL